jgi:hypothetical protein
VTHLPMTGWLGLGHLRMEQPQLAEAVASPALQTEPRDSSRVDPSCPSSYSGYGSWPERKTLMSITSRPCRCHGGGAPRIAGGSRCDRRRHCTLLSHGSSGENCVQSTGGPERWLPGHYDRQLERGKHPRRARPQASSWMSTEYFEDIGRLAAISAKTYSRRWPAFLLNFGRQTGEALSAPNWKILDLRQGTSAS